MSGLVDQYSEALEVLLKLFGTEDVARRLARLEKIFSVTEAAWERNLRRLPGIKIRYLLIAEAAPWTESGCPQYFYNNPSGPWVGRILRAFNLNRPAGNEATLLELARSGFLLIDTLPFAMPYRSKMRKKEDYCELLKASTKFFSTKLNDDRIKWSDDLRTALAFRLHGMATIRAYDGEIALPGDRRQALRKEQIAVDRSNYTSAERLQAIWRLPTC
jgi:hypothetical protein